MCTIVCSQKQNPHILFVKSMDLTYRKLLSKTRYKCTWKLRNRLQRWAWSKGKKFLKHVCVCVCVYAHILHGDSTTFPVHEGRDGNWGAWAPQLLPPSPFSSLHVVEKKTVAAALFLNYHFYCFLPTPPCCFLCLALLCCFEIAGLSEEEQGSRERHDGVILAANLLLAVDSIQLYMQHSLAEGLLQQQGCLWFMPFTGISYHFHVNLHKTVALMWGFQKLWIFNSHETSVPNFFLGNKDHSNQGRTRLLSENQATSVAISEHDQNTW